MFKLELSKQITELSAALKRAALTWTVRTLELVPTLEFTIMGLLVHGSFIYATKLNLPRAVPWHSY